MKLVFFPESLVQVYYSSIMYFFITKSVPYVEIQSVMSFALNVPFLKRKCNSVP